ncbi:hypothetical protein RvY_08596 [Ramazzottius varieornatus]|uniref:Uncharacterized protein n=1 Tax=Ramazzottius varieornatus TaxID=947166 RepID=A0A1D1V8P1_RAMVA|nr:hypothetical protein RvY_08596 [Ramazzottius varieornatus]
MHMSKLERNTCCVQYLTSRMRSINIAQSTHSGLQSANMSAMTTRQFYQSKQSIARTMSIVWCWRSSDRPATQSFRFQQDFLRNKLTDSSQESLNAISRANESLIPQH